jgi:hypothetical protein
MDAYNRGYDPGLVVDGTQIGAATISTDSEEVFRDPNAPVGTPTEAQDAGFYAIAYDWNGETIVSYRGTDDYSSSTTANDVLSGWLVGAGAVSPTTYAPGAQEELALDFYEAVTGQNPLATEGGNAILTGHSLGGGLAGAVGNC